MKLYKLALGARKAAHGAAPLLFGLLALGTAAFATPGPQQVTLAPAGPFHIVRNQILDSKGRAFLMRGTQLPEFDPHTIARDNRASLDFGPHSSTSLSAIRLRFNMNTVRLPINIEDAASPGYFAQLAKVVRRANEVELLVILAAREPHAGLPSRKTTEFWSRCAAFFKDYPNVMFDVFSDPSPSALSGSVGDAHSASGWSAWKNGMEDSLHAIRSAHAAQPVLAMSWNDDRLFEGASLEETSGSLLDDASVIYEVSPRYSGTRTDAQRDAHFGFLAQTAPVLANDWDLKLDDAAECSALPQNPEAVTQLVQQNLDYFDAHRISWTVSKFESGKLIKDLSLDDATLLDNGWTCGHPDWRTGLGRIVEAHMRSTVASGLFVVSTSGGPDLARGSFAIAYGPVLAERDARSTGPRLPLTLGGISVLVTDSRGVSRPARIYWAAAGWGQVNFVIPPDSALGPGKMTIDREDGSRTSTNITIADTAPGFWTGLSCRGAVTGKATQTFADGRTATSPVSSCDGRDCKTIAVPVADGAHTTVLLKAGGFRYAKSAASIQVTIGGIRVPVVSFGPGDETGVDQVTIEIPAALRGLGEADLIGRVNGRVSNAVRIRIGGNRPIS